MAGQIVSRGKNTWLVRVYAGLDGAGKRRYVNCTVHGTKKDAEQKLTATLRQRDLGIAIEPAQMKLDDFLEKWLEEVVKGKVRDKTFSGYRDVLGRYIRPSLGGVPLNKITALNIQTVLNGMTEAGLSPRTVQYSHTVLKQAFKQAVGWQMLVFNPCDQAKSPKQEHREMKCLSPDQARRFLAVAAQDRLGIVFQLALTTGMRPSEYLALKWEDIDFEAGSVSIRRSIEFGRQGGWKFAENKTKRSRRTIKLQNSVTGHLLRHRDAQESSRIAAGADWTEHGLVFANLTGGPLDSQNLSHRNMRQILRLAGLPQIRLYDLRHTAATLALSIGINVKIVSEMLGHTTTAFTMDRYTHVLPHMQDDAAARMETLLSEPVALSWNTNSRQPTVPPIS